MLNQWKKIAAPADIQNLSDIIISEEYAKSLKVREKLNSAEQYENVSNDVLPESLREIQNISFDDNCRSDSIIAKMLQRQFDKEYDDEICRVKKKPNGNAKLSISYDNSHNIPLPFTSILSNDDSEDNIFEAAAVDSEYFQTDEEELLYCAKRHDAKNKAKVAKHNTIICRRMACNLLDEPTRAILSKLINNGQLKSINGIISMGKKSVILHATAVKDLEEYAIKIYKTTPNMFKTCDKFIKHDGGFKNPREVAHMWAEKEMHIMRQLYFEDYPKLLLFNPYLRMKFVDRHNKRTYLKGWPNSYLNIFDALHKLYNMGRLMQDAMCANNVLYWGNTSIYEMQGLVARTLSFLNSPRLRFRKEHVLMMTFVGQHKKPAPSLKDVSLTPGEWQSAYNTIVDAMHELYHKGRLIHGHLNANNILWWKRTCWFIDFSQAVQRDHPSGYKFLLRDCRYIRNFFKNKEIQNIKSEEELFEWITGFEVAHFGRA